mgnify:CR=1 FL=1
MISKVTGQAERIKQEILAGDLAGVLTRFSDILLVLCVSAMVVVAIHRDYTDKAAETSC